MSQQKSKIIKYKPPGSFEETRFEKTAKESFASLISSKLISELIVDK